jgi:hypothetical protein
VFISQEFPPGFFVVVVVGFFLFFLFYNFIIEDSTICQADLTGHLGDRQEEDNFIIINLYFLRRTGSSRCTPLNLTTCTPETDTSGSTR